MNVTGSRGRRRRRRPMAEINVVPYIDVTLVLLIIFMVTAPMLQTGVDVDLPRAEAKPVDPNREFPIIVTINAGGELFLALGNEQDEPIGEGELRPSIAEALAKRPGIPVLIRGDRHVDYGRVVKLMAALKTSGVPSVGLMTGPEAE